MKVYILCIETCPETSASFSSRTEIERFVYHIEKNHSDQFQDYMDDMGVEARIESCELSTDLEEFKRFVLNVHAHSAYLDMHFITSEEYNRMLADYECSLSDCSEPERDRSPKQARKLSMTDVKEPETPVLSPANLSYLLFSPPETLPPLNLYPPPKEPEPVKLPLPPVQTPVVPPPAPLTLKQKFRQKLSGFANAVDSVIPEFSGFDDVALKINPPKKDPPPTAPPLVSSEPVYTAPALLPPTALGLYQKISTRTSALALFHDGVGVADLLAAEVKLMDMRRAGYNLVDVHLLVPQFEFLDQLGLDKALFGVKGWKVQDLAKEWGLPLQNVCTHLGFVAQDFVRCGFSLSDMQSLGLTMKTLVDLGAGFEFLKSFDEIPYEISARLSGTKEDLKRMNLSQEQKEWLCVEKGWSSVAMLSSFGLDARTVKLLWLAPVRK